MTDCELDALIEAVMCDRPPITAEDDARLAEELKQAWEEGDD